MKKPRKFKFSTYSQNPTRFGINQAKLRKFWAAVPWVTPITLYVDDIENSFRCIENNKPSVAKAYLKYPKTIKEFIQNHTQQRVHTLRYGYKNSLVNNGLNPNTPIVDLACLNASGKNAADICIAIDMSHLPLNINKVVMGSSDSDMSKIIEMLNNSGIETQVLAFGPMAYRYKTQVNCIDPSPLLEELEKKAVVNNQDPILQGVKDTLKHIASTKPDTDLRDIANLLEQRYQAKSRNWFGFDNCTELCSHLIPSLAIAQSHGNLNEVYA